MNRACTIDGKVIAAKLHAGVAAQVARMRAQHGFVPGLAVVLLGEDAASMVYVRSKAAQTVEVGMQSFEHKLPQETTEGALLDLVARLNRDPAVHGILVQMPLPRHIDSMKVLESIDSAKDVDELATLPPLEYVKRSLQQEGLSLMLDARFASQKSDHRHIAFAEK